MESVLENIKSTQDSFYSQTNKNIFMKDQQKIKCAEIVLATYPINELILKTIYIKDNSNQIFVSYPLYKTYALPSNYQLVVDRVIQLILSITQKYPTFEIHIDLGSFTVSAFQRNLSLFQLYYDTCCTIGLHYDKNIIDRIVIYNTPSVIQSLSSLIVKFTDKSIKEKITLLYKQKNT